MRERQRLSSPLSVSFLFGLLMISLASLRFSKGKLLPSTSSFYSISTPTSISSSIPNRLISFYFYQNQKIQRSMHMNIIHLGSRSEGFINKRTPFSFLGYVGIDGTVGNVNNIARLKTRDITSTSTMGPPFQFGIKFTTMSLSLHDKPNSCFLKRKTRGRASSSSSRAQGSCCKEKVPWEASSSACT